MLNSVIKRLITSSLKIIAELLPEYSTITFFNPSIGKLTKEVDDMIIQNRMSPRRGEVYIRHVRDMLIEIKLIAGHPPVIRQYIKNKKKKTGKI